ncbi:MAG: glutamate--tRNA ligase [Sedimentisphaerales bacterium]|nr:glutamate--tRNA ligase [Sedimentisphaerales bacterium]
MAQMVVVRFAPSPTGYLHIGGARTALFNWLFARNRAGVFILRIEDTDRKRNTPAALQQVINDLHWLGINWDQGPEIGGPTGPYMQSQRKDIYDKYVHKLLEKNKAYYCFETLEELNQLRRQAEAQRKNFSYPRPEKFPDESDVKKAKAQTRPVTVRFAVPQDEPFIITDVVRGEVKFGPGEIGDFIIQKSDGFPTYNFACVVDDELMGVTHVIRGQEHLMNTPAQQALQDALGFTRPVYAHMSVTISAGGGKLSKRERPKALKKALKQIDEVDLEKLAEVGNIATAQLNSFLAGKTTPDMPSIEAIAKYLRVNLPEVNVVDFFRSGYLPETMVNFLALLGWNPGDKREIMKADELIEAFDLSRLSKSNSLFDRDKLVAFNTEHIRIAPEQKLLEHFRSFLNELESPLLKADDDLLIRLLQINKGARTLSDIEKKCRFLSLDDDAIEYDEKAVKKILLKSDGLAILQIVRDKLAAMEEFTEDRIERLLRGLAEERAVGLGKVAQPLRVAICGTTVSPPIFDSVKILGKDNTLTRIDNTLKRFSTKFQV